MNRAMRFAIFLLFSLTAVFFAGRLSLAGGSSAKSARVQTTLSIPERQFEFTYQAHVPALPEGSAPLRIWVPLPPNNPYQTISNLHVESPVVYKVEREDEYGNRMAVFDISSQQAKAPFDIILRFDALRREHRVDLNEPHSAAISALVAPAELSRFLQPDRLVPLDGIIGALAKQETEGATDTLDKAHRIFEYVVSTLRYDKTGQGWGRGDAIFACTAKRGNCTDFHSLFIGMMRSAGIPAQFEIGFPLPADKKEGDIPGYHCWAEFYAEGLGWVPVDASEAWKNPPKREYFFGAHDTNRVLFTYGRDIRLKPEQEGDPLNYFIYPYAELNGKAFAQLQTHFSFRDEHPGAPVSSATQKSTD